jgi:hypothetical protein
LVVHHNTLHTDDEAVSVAAECDSREQLLDLNRQFEALDYHFVRLELIAPALT